MDVATQWGLPHILMVLVFNAQAASDIFCRRAQKFDTVSICFSKGLSLSDLLWSSKLLKNIFVPERPRRRQRQSGILAAALYAIEHNIERLKDDHANAKLLAKGPSCRYKLKNTHKHGLFEAHQAQKLVDARQENIFALAVGPTTIRMVTHLNVAQEHVQDQRSSKN